ncbi:putative multidrug resistance protein NorM [Hyphomicrobiales bacterium]|nr:putative multidrug resistance protein NorM [Hyphomicrobiales bacterium]CAH1700782.1 putative multidrug resistance protein NorM [Hyphomicrobiales bacterium]CAI0344655.1 putative multidrug resistance protein NorM [Hyphomicrobiales bacterium]
MTIADASRPHHSWLSEARAMLALSWPMVLTNVAQTAMTATGVIMMGHLGPEALAAGALGTNLYNAALIFGIGAMGAVAPMLAIELGRNKHAVRDLRRTVRQGFWAAATMVGPMWLFLWQAEFILTAMGQDPALSKAAASYIRTLQWGLLPFFLYLCLRGFVAALQRPRWAFIVVLGAVAFNAFANWCLMFGRLGFPALGLPGSGLATALSSALMFLGLALVVLLDRRFRRYHVLGRFWVPDWPRYRAFWRMGFPIALTLAFESLIFYGAAFMMGLIGATALAAHAIAIQIASLAFMVPLGIGQAGTVRVGRAFGAGDKEGIRRAGTMALILALGFMSFTALLMATVPDWLIAPFLDRSKPGAEAVAQIAVVFLFYAAVFQIADGAQVVGASILRGLGDTRLPMILAGIGYWGIGLPLSAALGFGTSLAGRGVWIGLATGLTVVAVMMLWRWWARERLGLLKWGLRQAA